MENALVFDLEKITDFIFGDPNARTNDVEITESYKRDQSTGTLLLDGKQIKEFKVNDYTGQNTIRYDLVKMFIEILDEAVELDDLSVGQQITLNTMESYGLIKEIKE